MSISGLKDVDREILKGVDDDELLRICTVDQKTWSEVCDDGFLRRRLMDRYPDIEKYKNENETWKQFFLRAIYYISKMREEFKFEYRHGNFKNQYDVLQMPKRDWVRYAIFEGELSLVKFALENNPKYDMRSALYLASMKGKLDIVKYLVERGVDIHADEEDALGVASQHGHLNVVKYLVEQGADVHAKEDDALVVASESGHLDVVKYLVEQGADIHARNEEPLNVAAAFGQYDIVRFLVEQGADISQSDALAYATANRHPDIVKYLTEHSFEI